MSNKTIETETGDATLRDDGSMVLDNSGYVQVLTAAQVQSAWNGKVIPHTEEVLEEIRLEDADLPDYVHEDNLVVNLAVWDDGCWNFGDEEHTIPDEEDFLGDSHSSSEEHLFNQLEQLNDWIEEST